MTADEPPALPARSFTAAARATWALAAMFVVHCVAAFLSAPHSKIEQLGVTTVVAMLAMNVLVAGGLTWLGFGLKRGRHAAVACAATAALGLMGLASIVGVVATSSGYQGTAALVVVQVLFGVVWLVAVTCAARAWTTPPAGR